MKTWKYLLSVFFVLVALSGLTVSHAADEVASGTCGENLTWVLTDDGTLTISGEGEMMEYNYSTWYSYCEQITTIVIENAVTAIGSYAFIGCRNLTSVTICDTVTTICEYAFYNCYNLGVVFYTGTEEQWNKIDIGSSNDGLQNAAIAFEVTDTASAMVTSGSCGAALMFLFNMPKHKGKCYYCDQRCYFCP